MQTTLNLPHWDLASVFPSLESPEFGSAFEGLVAAIAELRAACEQHGVRPGEGLVTDDAVAGFEDVTRRFNDIGDAMRTVRAYISGHVATDSRDDVAQAAHSELQRETVELTKLTKRYEAWIGSLDVDRLIELSPLARDHAFPLRQVHEAARHQMSEAEEELAATLAPSGASAWAKLHGDLTSRITAVVRGRDLPMSTVRGLAFDPEPTLREDAYRAELEAWTASAVPIAAALNSLKGWHNVLNVRRRWEDAVAPALFANAVDRPTLDAMQTACSEAFGDLRRYLQAKAKLLGHARLPWWDMFAPVGSDESEWHYEEATAFIVDRFGAYSDRLAGLASRAFEESWVDAEPRVGKRDGAFCMGIRPGESRVMLNYKPAFGSVATLAHELGHAYHNLNLADRTELQRRTPMTLAETASTFCQTIVTNAMLQDAEASEKLAILEHDLQNALQIVVDIHSRWLFEKAVFERRERRELSVAELCDAMRQAQAATYGDGLDPDTYHPFMWAVKPHYYASNFYNFPYTFGLLFGLGLYARYEADPDGFRSGYDDLLASTGLDDAATLAARFDIDVRDVGFWRSSLDVVRGRVAEYERLASA